MEIVAWVLFVAASAAATLFWMQLRGGRGAQAQLAAELDSLRKERDALTSIANEHARRGDVAEAKLALLSDTREQMKLEFKELAAEVMTGQSASFKEQNKEQIEALLNPLRERLTFFQESLRTAHLDSTKERAQLVEQIQQLAQTSSAMSAEATSLTRALRGETQTQGAWGEMILESILAKSGLRVGEEFVTQQSHTTADGGRLRTDVIVRLPSGEQVIVDSKVSLGAFDGYVNCEDPAERAGFLKAHVASIRAHIKTLGAKDYVAAAGSSLDYVILFIPIEGALALALREDPALTAFAVENNVPIATPTTLMIALRTIANLWQVERRNRNAEAIADRAGKLYEKFAGFVTDMQGLGARIDQAKKAYDGAMGKLSDGPGNLLRQTEQLKEMGAKTTKSLPLELLSKDGDTPANAAE
jgi:DNA recombination protein RmuC